MWRAPLAPPPEALAGLKPILSEDERQRADRFHYERDRRAFTVAHAALRLILSRYLSASPPELRFCESAHGKPSLAGDAGMPPLRFNLSHSHELALVAVSRGREVGVDLEWLRPELATRNVAEQYFSAAELTVLRALAGEAWVQGFFNCWTRKEAYIKARGEGLSMPLDAFDVALAPGEAARLLNTRPDPRDADRWRLVALHPGEGYAAAVAAEGQRWAVRCWDFQA